MMENTEFQPHLDRMKNMRVSASYYRVRKLYPSSPEGVTPAVERPMGYYFKFAICSQVGIFTNFTTRDFNSFDNFVNELRKKARKALHLLVLQHVNIGSAGAVEVIKFQETDEMPPKPEPEGGGE